jgi:drug/metabolite transporter (DMT)-like permease
LNQVSHVLLLAALLSGVAVSMLAWRITRFDPSRPERLIGELRVARWAAVVLAGVGAISIGLAVAHTEVPLASADAAFGAVFVGIAGLVLQREPREALLVAAAGFVLHALFSLAHRPGGLSPDLAPHWFTTASATYDVYVAAVCYWTRRR